MPVYANSMRLLQSAVFLCVCLVGGNAASYTLIAIDPCATGHFEPSCPTPPDSISPDGSFAFEDVNLGLDEWFSVPAGKHLQFEINGPYRFGALYLPFPNLANGLQIRFADVLFTGPFESSINLETVLGTAPHIFELIVPEFEEHHAPMTAVQLFFNLDAGSGSTPISFRVTPLQSERLTPNDFIAPTVEDFEGLLSPASGQPVAAPPYGMQFPSGLFFAGPPPGLPGISPFTIGDFYVAEVAGITPFGYDVEGNGFVGDPSFLSSGTAFAAPYGLPTDPFFFTFPSPVHRLGMYISANNGAFVRLTLFDVDGNIIESGLFPTAPVPLDADNFVGLAAQEPIVGISIYSVEDFIFDDVTFEVPEPSTTLSSIVAMVVLAVLALRRPYHQ